MNSISGNVFMSDGVFRKGTVYIGNGRIKKVVQGANDQEVNIIPGLVDIHFHGCAGYDFCDGTKEAYFHIESYENRHGITSICPATMTLPAEELKKICAAAAGARGEILSLIGIHLEGPFLSEAKKGAQNAKYLVKPERELLAALQKEAQGLIKVVSIAPEKENAMECIEQYHKEFIFSLAHTEADYETADCAIKKGANHITHLFNAMPQFGHRAPGVVGAAFDNKDTYVEVICDGIHIHPSMIRSIFSMFGEDRVVLVSDSMRAAGMEDGNYTLGGQAVWVKGNRAVLRDGTIAGSVTNLYDCMLNAIAMGIPPEKAIKAATVNPASSIGMNHEVGCIEEGKRADILVADKNFKLLKVISKGVWLDIG